MAPANRARDNGSRHPQFAQDFFQSVDVHRFGEAIINRLLHERMIRNLAVAHDVFEACELVGENCRQKILRFHPLQRRGDF